MDACDAYLDALDPTSRATLAAVNRAGLKRLHEGLTTREAIAFVGAGASTPLYPLWDGVIAELVDAAADRLDDAEAATLRTLAKTSPDAVVEVVRQQLRPEVYVEMLRELFRIRRDPASAALVDRHPRARRTLRLPRGRDDELRPWDRRRAHARAPRRERDRPRHVGRRDGDGPLAQRRRLRWPRRAARALRPRPPQPPGGHRPRHDRLPPRVRAASSRASSASSSSPADSFGSASASPTSGSPRSCARWARPPGPGSRRGWRRATSRSCRGTPLRATAARRPIRPCCSASARSSTGPTWCSIRHRHRTTPRSASCSRAWPILASRRSPQRRQRRLQPASPGRARAHARRPLGPRRRAGRALHRPGRRAREAGPLGGRSRRPARRRDGVGRRRQDRARHGMARAARRHGRAPGRARPVRVELLRGCVRRRVGGGAARMGEG